MSAAVVAELRAAGCVFAEHEAALIEADGRDVAQLVARRVAGEPLEYVLGWAEFMGRRFVVAPGVFVPRHRTELLVREAAALAPPSPLVVDVCCGSGALGLSLIDLVGGTLTASDIDPAAVRCALANGATAFEGDLFAAVPSTLRGSVDVILANAPYVPSAELALLPREARDFEAVAALDGGGDGLEVLRRVAAEASEWLVAGGVVVVEVSDRQADAAAALFAERGFEARTVAADSAAVVVATAPKTKEPRIAR